MQGASAASSEGDDRRPVLLLVDVEPDFRWPASRDGDGWLGTRRALPLLEGLRRALEQRTGERVTFNWFLRIDPQIEQVFGRADCLRDTVPQLLATIRECADYSGIHLHLWRSSPEDGGWYNELRDEAWLRHCLDVAIEGHRALLGHDPEACRFGDRWLSDAAITALQQRGIRYDLSVEPGRPAERPLGDRRARGWLPDTYAAPREPTQAKSSADAPLARDASQRQPLWIVPLSTSPPRWQPTHAAPYLIKASVSPNLGLSSLLVAPHLANELSRQSAAPLVLVMRTGDLAQPRRLRHFRRNVARLLAHENLVRCTFTTPPAAIRAFVRARAT